jgi:hypothetical protein
MSEPRTVLASRRPKPRYLVGIDAKSMAALDRLVPTQVKDLATRLTLGL